MRNLSPGFSAHLAGGATQMCWVWRLTRRDGHVIGFTDHDRPLEFDGLTCRPELGLTQAGYDHREGFAVDHGDMTGLIDSQAITLADIEAGLYDSAKLEMFRVVWSSPDLYVHMSTGHLGEIRVSGNRLEAEWIGQGRMLERSTGRVFSKYCDAEFGDARCGLNAGDYPSGTSCPRSFSACQDFGNTGNFRGFPYLIGGDALLAAPREGDIRDGGSRYA